MASKFVEAEAVDEDDEEDGRADGGGKGKEELDSSEEDEDEPNEYEDDGFLVDDDADEDDDGGGEDANGDDEEEPKKKRRKKRKQEEPEFEEGDLSILEEAGVKIKKKGKLRRLKRHESDDEDPDVDEEDDEKGSKRKGVDEDIDYDEDEDKMDDFIEDDEGGRKKTKGMEGVSSAALEEAREIFGDQEDVEELQGIDFLVVSDAEDDDDDAGEMQRAPDVEEGDEIRDMEDMRKLTLKLDPSLAAERFLTDRDEEIRKQDMPEYLQEHFGTRKRSSKEELLDEATWIYKMAFAKNAEYEDVDEQALITKIHLLLVFVHSETLDVPFVAVYRKEYVMDDLLRSCSYDKFGDWTGLWMVLDWDNRWAHLCDRRKAVLETIKTLENGATDAATVEGLTGMAKAASDEHELQTLERHAHLLREQQLAEATDKSGGKDSHRRPRRRDRYRNLCKSGLRDLVYYFGITAKQFSENLQAFKMIHRPQDPASGPQDVAIAWATQNRSTNLDDPAKCLALARQMIVTEITADSGVVNFVKGVFGQSAQLSVVPTPKARKDVDDNHPMRPYCTITDKPASEILRSRTGEYLMMQQVEEEGLGKIELTMRQQDFAELEDDFSRLYMSQNLSAVAREWNEQRQIIIKDVLKVLLDNLKKEVYENLALDAQLKLKMQVTRAADRELNQGPLRLDSIEGAPKVLSITVTEKHEDEEAEPEAGTGGQSAKRRYMGGSTMLSFVMLDVDGDILDSTEMPGGFLRRKRDDPLPEDISEALWKNVVSKFRPNVIAIGIGSGGKDPLRLKQDLIALVGDMVSREDASYLGVQREDGRDFEEIQTHLGESRVVLVPDTVASTFARSSSCMSIMSNYTYLQRRCTGVGRLVQEPQTVYGAIIADKSKFITHSFSKFDHLVPGPMRRDALHRSMIRAVCTTGFDINRAMLHGHMRPLMQFVGGLGPRKAEVLAHAIETSEDGMLLSRLDLMVKNFLGRNVFYSASGFLRVRDPELGRGGRTATEIRKRIRGKKGGRSYDPREDSRMHPEIYNVAIKIAEQSVDEAPKKNDASAIILEVMENPDLLEALDLDQYAEDLEAKGRGKNRETVRLIVEEFQDPYKDPRAAMRNPSDKEIFKAVTNLDPAVELAPGSIVTVSDCRVQNSGKGVNCTVAGLVRGFIHISDVSDQRLSEENLAERVVPGASIVCRVLELNPGAFDVKLACRASVLNNPRSIQYYQEPAFHSDPYFKQYDEVHDQRYLDDEAEKEKKRVKAKERMMLQLRKDSLARRSTRHPFWKDVGSEEAERLVADAPIGEIVIRPGSTKKSVSFTYKLYHGIVAHFKVNEEQEPGPNGAEPNLVYVEANAGSSAERFADLDEVLSRVIEPIIANYNDAVNYRNKFQDVSWPELQATLRDQKRRNPNTIPYLYCPERRRDRLGALILGFVPGTKTVMRTTIIVTADGFKLRNVMHPTLSALFDWFKKNYRTLEGQGTALAPSTPRTAHGMQTPSHMPAGLESGRSTLVDPAAGYRDDPPMRPVTPSRAPVNVPAPPPPSTAPPVLARPVAPPPGPPPGPPTWRGDDRRDDPISGRRGGDSNNYAYEDGAGANDAYDPRGSQGLGSDWRRLRHSTAPGTDVRPSDDYRAPPPPRDDDYRVPPPPRDDGYHAPPPPRDDDLRRPPPPRDNHRAPPPPRGDNNRAPPPPPPPMQDSRRMDTGESYGNGNGPEPPSRSFAPINPQEVAAKRPDAAAWRGSRPVPAWQRQQQQDSET